MGKCRYSVPEPTPASRAMSSRRRPGHPWRWPCGPRRGVARRSAWRRRAGLWWLSLLIGWRALRGHVVCLSRVPSAKRGNSHLTKRRLPPYSTTIQTETVPVFLVPTRTDPRRRHAPHSNRPTQPQLWHEPSPHQRRRDLHPSGAAHSNRVRRPVRATRAGRHPPGPATMSSSSTSLDRSRSGRVRRTTTRSF